ncbi:MAG TPA: hypothetical protein DDY31_04425 [Lachnospiraceae bacterium]|nr:hypothetical protein [Lachnospiraceae bacterium]
MKKRSKGNKITVFSITVKEGQKMRKKSSYYDAKKSYAGYGLTKDMARSLLQECRAGKHTELVQQAARQAAPCIERWIISSIVEGKSLHDMEIKWELGESEIMPCCRNSFYARRKYTLAILNKMLEEKEV